MNFPEEKITATVEEITFQNDTNGFTVMDVSMDDDYLPL